MENIYLYMKYLDNDYDITYTATNALKLIFVMILLITKYLCSISSYAKILSYQILGENTYFIHKNGGLRNIIQAYCFQKA